MTLPTPIQSQTGSTLQARSGDTGPTATLRGVALPCLALGLLLSLVATIALAVGTVRIPVVAVGRAILAKALGQPIDLAPSSQMILFEIRSPRILLAIVAGAALSVAGALLQAMLRNPLAEPYVLGVSGGAAAGALTALLVAASIPWAQPAFAFLGALASMSLVYALGRQRTGISTERLILAGVIMASFWWAAIAATISVISSERLRNITFWLMGNLSGRGSGLLGIVTLGTLLAIVAAYLHARSLNVLMVGEEDARVLGVAVERVKTVVLVVASILTGLIVSVCGMIAYVGLVVPHIVRLAGRSDHRFLIPVSALCGALFVLIADTLARTVLAPQELPVGAITALIGAPLFVYLLRRSA